MVAMAVTATVPDVDVLAVLMAMEAQAIGSRAEFIEGVYALNRPTPDHQRTILRLATMIETPDKVGLVPEVRVSDNDETWIVPDLVAIPDAVNDPVVNVDDVLLMVEVLSPSTEARDRGAKRAFAKRHGIDYWIVTAGDELLIEVMPYGGNLIQPPTI